MKKRIFALLLLLIIICVTFVACKRNTEDNLPVEELPIEEEVVKKEDFSLPSGTNWYSKIEGREYGKIEHITYFSELAGADKHANVILPQSYENKNKSYPVLYLLHGLASNEYSWIKDMSANYIVQNLHQDESCAEMIVVCVNCIVNETEKEPSIMSTALTAAYDKTGQDIVENLMPYINNNYRTKTGKENTAIAGYSMGGREALYAAFSYQDKFAFVGAFSSANFNDKITSIGVSNPIITKFEIAPNSTGFDLILLNIGVFDSFTAGVTQNVDKMLNEAKIEHLFYMPLGAHDYSVWRDGLYNFVKRIFK